jgi:hypothetical protein
LEDLLHRVLNSSRLESILNENMEYPAGTVDPDIHMSEKNSRKGTADQPFDAGYAERRSNTRSGESLIGVSLIGWSTLSTLMKERIRWGDGIQFSPGCLSSVSLIEEPMTGRIE